MTIGGCALGCAVVFAFLAFGALQVPAAGVAAVALAGGTVGALALAAWAGLQLRAWPTGKLAFFRDRLLVVHGRHEMRAPWELIDTVTLANPSEWPRIRITDRLTINFRNEPPIRFKPANFGLEAVACRDLVLKLRDEAALRERLPEFDSARDLAASPVVAGELFELRF